MRHACQTSSRHALVTGATGFLGYHLVRHLTALGHEVTCLVRPQSTVDRIQGFAPRFVLGDVTDPESVRCAVAGMDDVYHLAGLTKSLRMSEMYRVNVAGARTVAACCAQQESPPVLIAVSSLAAAGPSPKHRRLTEADPAKPVSHYGRSKRDGELAVAAFASQVPTTILRPPIVVGEGDQLGLPMFQSIARWGVHHLPSVRDHRYSVLHAEDLAVAMQLAAGRGRRLSGTSGDGGVYFVADDETPTYAELGRMIGRALGRTRVWVIRNPRISLWAAAAANELVSRLIRRQQHVVNMDKVREATAGSWTCSAESIRRDLGFSPAQPLQQRLCQTVDWYLRQQWLHLKQPLHVEAEVHHQTCCRDR